MSPMLSPWQCFQLDRARYPRRAWITHRSLWAIAAYRFAQASTKQPLGIKLAVRPLSVVLTLLARITTNIEIATSAEIGPGLQFGHAGPIVIHGDAKIGRDCTMSTGVVIGARVGDGVPVIGDRVRLGTYAVVLGNLTVGDDVYIGAMTLVIKDVESGDRVGGVPARVLRSHQSSGP